MQWVQNKLKFQSMLESMDSMESLGDQRFALLNDPVETETSRRQGTKVSLKGSPRVKTESLDAIL